MSHSVSPLGSLSSPSPSPPPNPIDESELSELTDDDHDDDDDDDDPPPTQRQRRLPNSTPSVPSSKRKKRGGLVPAPMWDWAYKNGATSPTSTPTPARCLSPPSQPGPSRPSHTDHDPLPSRQKSRSPSLDPEEEEEEELPTPPRAMEEEEGEDPDPRKDHPLDRKPSQRKAQSRSRKPRKKVQVPLPFDSSKMPRSKRGIRPLTRISFYQNEKMLKSLWEQGYKLYDPTAPSSDEERSNGSILSPSPSNSDQEDMLVDDDTTSPRHSPARPTLNTNLKATPPPSASAIDNTADFPSVPPSIRASVDPTVSPPDEDLPQRPITDEDIDQDHDPGTPDDDDRHPPRDRDLEPDEDEDVQPEEPSQPPSPTPLVEPEQEQEDEDPDLQPAHRAEALDVLATIELKFALLRERVYVEKLEGLAWEEALVWDGTHPELHHLQSELTKRRDKRLLLASKKRTYEIDAIARKRREEEIWCWDTWDISRTELQTDMIAETNRKRRKLERERRAIERPPGARRIPSAILNPPPAPTLRQIANTFPLPSHLSHLATNKKLAYAKGLGVYPGLDGLSGATAYPDLGTLSPHEIAADLEFLFQHRRLGYGYGMGFVPPIGVPIGVGYNSTTPGYGPAPIGFAGPTPTPGFGVNGVGIGPSETYPSNSGPGIAVGNNTSQIAGPAIGSGPGLGPTVPSAPSSASLQSAPNTVIGPGPGIANPDGPSFSQPAMGVFQGAPSVTTGPTGYPMGSGGNGTSIVIGPGGTASAPVMGPGAARIQRPSGFVERERELQREKEREMIQRDREMRERELTPRDRELATQREREFREREREFGPNVGPGYPAWNSKPAGGMDWAIGRREERERIERSERDRDRERCQAQPIVPTPTHRHLHQHTHPHSHTHQMQQHPAQPPHPAHVHQSHSHQHSQHHHSQHPHHHAQHQHATSHVPPHHHVGQHHHHRHHHHVVHHHHSSASGSGTSSSAPDGASPLSQGSGSAPGIQTMEIINLSANPSSKSHWKRDEAKLGGNSMPGSRPPSTHPLPSYEERERDRDRERERDRPVATPFVLAPSHHTISSAASSPRHGWTPGPSESGPATTNVSSSSFSLPPERLHTPVPHRFSNLTSNGLSHLPRPLTTSPPRGAPTSISTTSPSISALNVPLPSSTSNGPFPLQRKPSPALPKLGMTPLGYSPRLAGPGVVPPTGPGVPGVLSTTAGGPGVTPSGILTSGPGVPPGPGIAPAPPGDSGPSMFANRTTSPLIPYTGPPPIVSVPTQKVGVDGP